MEEKKPRFTSEVIIELPLFREFLNLSIDIYRRNIVIMLLMSGLILHAIANMTRPFYIPVFILFAITFPLSHWVRRRKYNDGGVPYKQLLFQHEGKTPHQIALFQEDQLVFQNLCTGTERKTPYSQYVQLWESKNLLVLILDVNMYQLIDKRTLTGGTGTELVAFLREKCPNLKRKVATGRLGRFARRLLWTLIAIGTLVALLNLFHIPDKLAGKITNDLTYEEMALELSEVGITISSDVLSELQAYEGQSLSYGAYPKVLDLLTMEAMGRYDWDTWEWTPSTSGVYWFDTEVMNLESIYSDFLRGVDAMDETLTFSNIAEDYSAVDMESGLGIVTFSFDYLGQTYTLNAQYEYDWFDTNILYHMGLILNDDSDPKNLWYTFDGQGVLLFYDTREEAAALDHKTGLIFLDPVNHPLYG